LDRISFRAFAFLVNHPEVFEVVTKVGGILQRFHRFVAVSKFDPLLAWTATREAPVIAKESFRQYWKSRHK
jgi:L-lactate dehydrogenase complex protein LldF